jgi:hypothetical protein
MNALSAKVEDMAKTDLNFIDALFDSIWDDLVTNMTRGRMLNEMSWAKDYTANPITRFPGEHESDSQGFTAFYPNNEAIREWVLITLYNHIE